MAVIWSLDMLKDDRVLRKHSSQAPSPVSGGVPAVSGLVQSTTSATAGNDARQLNSLFPAFQPRPSVKAPPPGITLKGPPPVISIGTPPRCSSPPPPPPHPPFGATSPGSSAAAPAALEIPSGSPKNRSPVADPAAAADARAAQQRGDEIARGLRVLKTDFVRKVGDWDISVYARLERYRDSDGREWQYDPLAYQWKYLDDV